MRKGLSIAQRRALRNLFEGRRSSAGLFGMSEFGGHTRVLWSLRRQGLIDDDNRLTEAGSKVAKEIR